MTAATSLDAPAPHAPVMTPIVVALVVVNHAAGKRDLAALAVDRVVGRGDMLIERGRVGDQLEDRAGLVDIADRVVPQQCRRGVAKVVGVERGPDGERQNLAGVHVLHDDGAVVRLRFLHGVIEGSLGHELNILVDGEHQVLARLGLALGGTEHVAARVHGGVHAPGDAVQLTVELLLEAAEAVVVDAHIAQHLRGDLVVGIEALKLFLKVDALHVEGAHLGRDLRRDAARDPGKVVPVVEALRRSGLRVVRSSSGSVWTMAASMRAAACLSSISLGTA